MSGSITFSGVNSGMDWDSIISQMVTAEGYRLDDYEEELEEYNEKLDAISSIRTSIEALLTSIETLADTDDMEIFSASSSDDDILTVSTTDDASAGSHTIEVNQLASSETWIQEDSEFEYETDYVGGGTFIFTYNNETCSITTVEDETTLEDLVNLINNDEDNPGVTASLVYQSGTYHLMLTGQDSGSEYEIEVNSYTSLTLEAGEDDAFTTDDGSSNASSSTKIKSLDQFDGSLGDDDCIIIGGTTSDGTVLPETTLEINSNTTVGQLIDSINEAFEGVATARLENGRIVLVSETEGTDTTTNDDQLSITLTYQSSNGDSDLELPTFEVTDEGTTAATLFDPDSFVQTQEAQDAELKVDGFPSSSANEVQSLTFDETETLTTGETFYLIYEGETSAEITIGDSAEDIQAILEAMEGIGEGNVSVTGDLEAGTLQIEFTGDLAATDVSKFVISNPDNDLGATITVEETTTGNNGWLSRSSNTVSDVVSGVKLTLKNVTDEDDPITISVTQDTSSITDTISSMVEAYNELIELVDDLSTYDDETEEMGILSTDYSVTSLTSDIRTPFSSIVDGFTSALDEFITASDIGLTIEADGTMEFDSDEFDDAINEDVDAVLDLLGATGTGNSSSNAVEFYACSETYTVAGTYNVVVEVSDGAIVSVGIEIDGEWNYDVASWSDNVITFDSTFEDGEAVYDFNSLQLTVSLTDGTYGTEENPIEINVKQGIFTQLEDILEEMVDTDGLLDTSEESMEDKIDSLEEEIEEEEDRLLDYEERLVEKFARLEARLAELEEQQSAVTALLS